MMKSVWKKHHVQMIVDVFPMTGKGRFLDMLVFRGLTEVCRS